ncbi:MAG: ribbon-helix-helix domain-containing protein [Candidatus Thermoplasmatota archaeon]|jgi:Arc/MetJ-type ribon-helix-helix transcriptional regulator|nr:ribbon-helix-helix domain-containing protein [Candidatus Thermoplasmatota archaeon]MCL5963709.1 ribbon-helix-helix domain-containing protein [Candidatus Thermoplasmatota archaeon]
MIEKKEDTIAVRLSTSEIEDINSMIDMGEGKSKSDIIRNAIHEYIEIHKPTRKSHKIIVNIPEFYYIQIQNLIDMGLVNSTDDLLNQSIKLWINNESSVRKNIDEINHAAESIYDVKNKVDEANKNIKK